MAGMHQALMPLPYVLLALLGSASAYTLAPGGVGRRARRAAAPAMADWSSGGAGQAEEVRARPRASNPRRDARGSPAQLRARFAPTRRARRRAQLEFIIHADGRVEERVRGIKGANCQAITAEIEEALGEVYETKATEEMFEQPVELSATDEVGQEVRGDWSAGSEW